MSCCNNDIYKILEQEIVSLKVFPGDVLTENTLCERFGISRTPIRSVLQRLQENGFVEIVPHKSTTVTAINLDIATQLIYERVAVEQMVLRDFIRVCTPTDVEHVRFWLNEMKEMAQQSQDPATFDNDAFLAKDYNMHAVWFQALGKSYLWDRLISPHPDYSRLMRLDSLGRHNTADVLKDHEEIMHLIDTRNPDGLEEVLTRHLYGGVRRLGGKLFSPEYSRFFKK